MSILHLKRFEYHEQQSVPRKANKSVVVLIFWLVGWLVGCGECSGILELSARKAPPTGKSFHGRENHRGTRYPWVDFHLAESHREIHFWAAYVLPLCCRFIFDLSWKYMPQQHSLGCDMENNSRDLVALQLHTVQVNLVSPMPLPKASRFTVM